MSKQRDKDKQKRAAEKAASKVSQDPQGEASGNQAITPKGQTKPAPKAGKHQKTGTTGQTPPAAQAGQAPQGKPAGAASGPELPFGPENFKLIGLGVLLLLIGYYLLSLDPFIDATKFSISLYIAPVVIIGGYVEIIFAILKRPAKHEDG